MTTNNNDNNVKKENNEKNNILFDEFRNSYPNKKSKQKAEAIYKKLIAKE
jgi:hypothetical protein